MRLECLSTADWCRGVWKSAAAQPYFDCFDHQVQDQLEGFVRYGGKATTLRAMQRRPLMWYAANSDELFLVAPKRLHWLRIADFIEKLNSPLY
jgi:hypothetical protein